MNIFRITSHSSYLRGLTSVVMGALLLITSPVRAETCLKFGSPIESIRGLTVMLNNFKAAMADANICAEFQNFPMERSSAALIEGRLDGIVFRVPSFGKVVGGAAHMVPEAVGSGTALLVSFDPQITSLKALGSGYVGIRRGTRWTIDIVKDRENVIRHYSYTNLIAMLEKKRVQAILVNSVTAQLFEKQLEGATVTPIGDLSVYVWLSTDQMHRSEEIAAAIRSYRVNGRDFLDPIAVN